MTIKQHLKIKQKSMPKLHEKMNWQFAKWWQKFIIFFRLLSVSFCHAIFKSEKNLHTKTKCFICCLSFALSLLFYRKWDRTSAKQKWETGFEAWISVASSLGVYAPLFIANRQITQISYIITATYVDFHVRICDTLFCDHHTHCPLTEIRKTSC